MSQTATTRDLRPHPFDLGPAVFVKELPPAGAGEIVRDRTQKAARLPHPGSS
jgi:hypothetical protein